MTVLAFDIGASSGRAIIGKVVDGRIQTQEVYRFPNEAITVGNHLYWSIHRLFDEMKIGIKKAALHHDIESIAIDTWAVDFGLLDDRGVLVQLPYHYRDKQTEGMMSKVRNHIQDFEIYSKTGIQFMPINTLYHLYAMKENEEPALEKAETLLMIPDLLRYFLTGEKYMEFTNATTTQLFNPNKGSWDDELLNKLGIPAKLFSDVKKPGEKAGELLPEICEETGVERPIPVYTVGEHDTASAVVSCPTEEEDFAYLSCGTWSLLGTEIEEPILSKASFEMHLTNEGGVDGTFRLLKNIMGLWIVQQCLKEWEEEGTTISYEEQKRMIQEAPAFQTCIDPDEDRFIHPPKMVEAIQEFAKETDQPVPRTKGEILRTVLESLSFKYRSVLERLEKVTGKQYQKLYMFGGGIQNQLLCQWTANAIQRKVSAGPVEASSIGNMIVQFQSLGKIETIQEGRQMVRESFPIKEYQPEDSHLYEEGYQWFLRKIDKER